jgi:hypothetical protein
MITCKAAWPRRWRINAILPGAFPLRTDACELRFERGCDEFPGRRGSEFVSPVASDPALVLSPGMIESDGRS